MLGCQHAQKVGELNYGAQDIVMQFGEEDEDVRDSNHIPSPEHYRSDGQPQQQVPYDYYGSHCKTSKTRSKSMSDRNLPVRTEGKQPHLLPVKTSVVNLDQATKENGIGSIGRMHSSSGNMSDDERFAWRQPTAGSGSGEDSSRSATRASENRRSVSFQSYYQQQTACRSLLGTSEPLRSFNDTSSISSDRRFEYTSGSLPVLIEEDDGEEEDTMATVTTSFSGGALYSSDHFPEISDYRPSEASKDAGPLLSMLKKRNTTRE